MRTLDGQERYIAILEEAALAASDKADGAVVQFSEIFKAERQKKRISLRDAAKAIGISPAFLSDCELGRRYPNAEMRKRFIQLFK